MHMRLHAHLLHLHGLHANLLHLHGMRVNLLHKYRCHYRHQSRTEQDSRRSARTCIGIGIMVWAGAGPRTKLCGEPV